MSNSKILQYEIKKLKKICFIIGLLAFISIVIANYLLSNFWLKTTGYLFLVFFSVFYGVAIGLMYAKELINEKSGKCIKFGDLEPEYKKFKKEVK